MLWCDGVRSDGGESDNGDEVDNGGGDSENCW